MKHKSLRRGSEGFINIAIAVLLAIVSPAAALTCMPTCASNDGRFLQLAGAGLSTMADQSLSIVLAVPATQSTIEVGIFDGDTNLGDPLTETTWDVGVPMAITHFTVFEDPLCNGSGTVVAPGVGPGAHPYDGQTMPNGDWFDFIVPVSAGAQSPSGIYCYTLFGELMDPALIVTNSFKVRTNATIRLGSQPFAFSAATSSLQDVLVLYPDFVPPPVIDPSQIDPSQIGNSTYDGSFSFFLDVFTGQSEVTVWDGDLDRGKFDGSDLDEDDLDTPPLLPPWSVAAVVAEGALPASPSDDRDPSGFGFFFLRSPSVFYEMLLPDGGDEFTNFNPSANREWEQFRVSIDPFDPTQMDHSTPDLPPGAYELRLSGMDVTNLNAWRFTHTLMGVTPDGDPVPPLRPYLVGDTVFSDKNENGIQDTGEPGIGGVTVELIDSFGNVLATTTTNAGGGYRFSVEALTTTIGLVDGIFDDIVIYDGVYSVHVTGSNFSGSGRLVGAHFTTPGGDNQTDTVIDDNVLTYDFGLAGRNFTPPAPAPVLSYWGLAASIMLLLGTAKRHSARKSPAR